MELKWVSLSFPTVWGLEATRGQSSNLVASSVGLPQCTQGFPASTRDMLGPLSSPVLLFVHLCRWTHAALLNSGLVRWEASQEGGEEQA